MFRSIILMVAASIAATYTIRYIDKKLAERNEAEAKYFR